MPPKRPTAADFMKPNPNVDSRTPTDKSMQRLPRATQQSKVGSSPVSTNDSHVAAGMGLEIPAVLNPSPTNWSSNFVEGVVSKDNSRNGVGNTNNTTTAPDTSSVAKNDVISSKEGRSITRNKDEYVVKANNGATHTFTTKRVPKDTTVGVAANGNNIVTSGVTKYKVVTKSNAAIQDNAVTKPNSPTETGGVTDTFRNTPWRRDQVDGRGAHNHQAPGNTCADWRGRGKFAGGSGGGVGRYGSYFSRSVTPPPQRPDDQTLLERRDAAREARAKKERRWFEENDLDTRRKAAAKIRQETKEYRSRRVRKVAAAPAVGAEADPADPQANTNVARVIVGGRFIRADDDRQRYYDDEEVMEVLAKLKEQKESGAYREKLQVPGPVGSEYAVMMETAKELWEAKRRRRAGYPPAPTADASRYNFSYIGM
ncbi:hypothetical protein BZA05DRAFT_462054 [Tricharina praecox]|uniref:uncharacterized protein n=1 Tax=Tricharina praecox TaxID=43433 RepID=UPI00221ED8A3|nr:uncharacterized protein BZA05DRAFT_462054 [Tricharina praecox]KAI5842343.1 hypothetical protein BZA05DRAFT_462054 [Tricharina praecox]